MEPLDPNTPVLEIPPGLSDRPILDPKLANPPAVPRLAGGNLPASQPTWDGDLVLLRFGAEQPFTLRHASAGVIIFGETGSGKTSGPCKTILLNYLKQGFGGLVLCVKPEEGSDWVNYARAAGRERDVIRITADPNCKYWYDFLAHEMNQPGSNTLSTVLTIQSITDVLRQKGGGKGGDNDAFWSASANRLIKNAIDLYKLAYHGGRALKASKHLPADEWVPEYKPTILFILELITSAITNAEDLESPSAIARSLNLRCLRLARKVAEFHAKSPSEDSANLVNIFNLTDSFWRTEWAKDGLGDSRLRDNIVAFAQSAIEPLERGEVANLFQRKRRANPETGQDEYVDTVTPDMVDQGKLIIVDVPVNKWLAAGKLAGAIWKHSVQRFLDLRTETTRQKVEAVKAEFYPAVIAAERRLANLPESFADRNLPGFLRFGPRRAALDEYAYAEYKYKHELKLAEDSVRPIFIWVDEYQNFIVRGDVLFQATARSGRACVVYATQTIASLDEAVGSDMREAMVSNMTTKIFCKNKHAATNQWASDTIGSEFRYKETTGETYQNFWHLIPSLSRSRSKELTPRIPAGEFTLLKIGGPLNNCEVGAVVIGADLFGVRTTWLKTIFDQNVGRPKVVVPDKIKARAIARVRREAR